MRITLHNQSLFHITTQDKKNGLVNIIIDPFALKSKTSKLEADILLLSRQNEKAVDIKSLSGNPFLINGPGEYEIKQVFIRGIFAKDEENKEIAIYTIEAEDLKLCYLGGFDQKELIAEQLEKIGDVDILIIPVMEAKRIINQVEPKIVIPTRCKSAKEMDKFLKTMGLKSIEPQNKLVIKKKDLPQKMEIIILSDR